MKFSKEKHGRSTYVMAWLAELSLFTLAMMLAVFNVLSVWHNGSRIQGLILGGGWFVLAVIELSIIPLAGALRICKWKDKWVAFIAVIGLALLSAWTVYEFNEFASYYLTRPARDAVIRIDNKKQELANLKQEIVNASKRHETATNELARLIGDQASHVRALEKGYKAQMDLLRAEHEAKIASLRAILPESKTVDAATQDTIRNLQEKIGRIEAERDSRTISLQQETEKRLVSASAASETRRKTLEAQRAAAQSEVAQLRQTMLAEMEAVSGTFRESKKNRIRDRYQSLTEATTSQIAKIDESIRESTAPQTGLRSGELESIRGQAAAEIAQLERRIESVRKDATEEFRVDQLKIEKEASGVRAEIARLEQEYRRTVDEKRPGYEAELTKEKQSFTERRQTLIGASLTEAQMQQLLESKHAVVARLEAQIVEVQTQTDAQMEPVLYYRIAKWFHEGPGLPSKNDYLKAQIYLFGPAGLFLGLVSIALAYIGTGLQNDQSPTDQFERHIQERDQELRAKEKVSGHLERRIQEQDERISNLMADIVKGKTDFARAAARIPQTIVLTETASAFNGHVSKEPHLPDQNQAVSAPGN